MKIWVVGRLIDYEGTIKEYLFIEEKNARIMEKKLIAEDVNMFYKVYCYSQETED